MYFHADELLERLPKYAAYRAECEEKEMEEYQAAMQQYLEEQEAQ
ncbi:hypothetical protein [Pseudomonas putida]